MVKKEIVLGIAGNKKKPLAKKTALRAITFLKKNRIKFLVDSGFLKTHNSISLKKMRVDLFIVFGGDGTLLHVVREMGKQKPVLGINCGTHGHIMEARAGEAETAIAKILAGKFRIEERSRLSVLIDGKSSPSALNEIIVAPKQSFTLSEFSISAGKKISRHTADAVTVATPTGSTAFAFAAGGKKIAVGKKLFEVMPVHPFGGAKKAFLVSDGKKIEIFPFEKGVACEVIIDGQRRMNVKKKVVIRKNKEPAMFVRLC